MWRFSLSFFRTVLEPTGYGSRVGLFKLLVYLRRFFLFYKKSLTLFVV